MLPLIALFWLASLGDAAERMIRMALFATSEPEYRAVEGCRVSPVTGNVSALAMLEDSYSCRAESGGIHREQRFYATEHGIRMQYVHVWMPLAEPGLRDEIEQVLTKRFGAPRPAHRPYVPGIGIPHDGMLRWVTERGQLVLHEKAFYNRDAMTTGVQLIGVSHDRWQMALDDRVSDPPAPNATRLFADTVALLRRVGGADPAARAELLVRADAMVEQLASVSIDPEKVRKALAPFGIRIGEPTHYAGLEYWREPLWQAYREHSGTTGGSAAVLRLLRLGWPEGESTGSFCTRPDTFARVIENGEAYLAKHPDAKHAAGIRFTLAEAYETWWSGVKARKDEALTYEQFLPVRHKYVGGASEALERAIANYEAVVQADPSGREARLAQRRLPRLQRALDTGQRRFLCVMC